jgi:hypothetical protein
VSSVPRHSEEELRRQWAFLDQLVERQASSLKSGVQDPEEEDLPVVAGRADVQHGDEITTLTQRVTTLEVERTTLLRRIDLAEEARLAAETARAAAEAARDAAERALAEAHTASVFQPQPPRVETSPVAAPAPEEAVVPANPPAVAARRPSPEGSPVAASPRRRSWWQRFRD